VRIASCKSLFEPKSARDEVRNNLVLVFLCVALAGNAPAQHGRDSSTSHIIIFPGHKIFPQFTADGLSHQLSLSRVTENRDWIGAVGGSIPIAQFNTPGTVLQGSVAVTIFNRLVKTPGHLTVYTVDYKVDFPIDIRLSSLALRFAVGHISCHFADDAIEQFGKQSIQHVNDYVTLAAAYDVPAIGGYVYGRFNYSYGTQPVQHKPWLLQVGAHLGNLPLHDEVTLYGAFDLKVKEEVGWGSIRSIQVGIRLFPRMQYGLRLAYTLRTGFEERGQFYLNKVTNNLLSAFIDF
jgi:hypothetical protein